PRAHRAFPGQPGARLAQGGSSRSGAIGRAGGAVLESKSKSRSKSKSKPPAPGSKDATACSATRNSTSTALEFEFLTWLTDLMAELKESPGVTPEIRSQLDRASLSTLLNTAEGNGKRERQLRVRYFDHARGSAAECAACLDALVARRVTTAERVE